MKTKSMKKVLKKSKGGEKTDRSHVRDRIPQEKAKQSSEISQPEKNIQPLAALIFITGESPMVEQYAEICAGHGYHVCVSWNETPAKKPEFLSSNIIISGTMPARTSVAIELTNIDLPAKRKNLTKFDSTLPETAPILSSSVTVSATEQSSWISGKHRLVGIAALPSLIERPLVEVASTIYSPKETIEVVSRFFSTLGKGIEIVQDRIGMVMPRILCQIINEAAFVITEDIAALQDIDKALKHGARFPLGPIEWAERIGLRQVHAVLTALYTDLQEERYRVAPLLKQMAITDVWWTHETP